MYISKVVFGNLNEFTQEELDRLREANIVCDTDYGTTEVLSDTVRNLKSDETGNLVESLELLEILADRLGTDVVEALLKNEIDFVLMVED